MEEGKSEGEESQRGPKQAWEEFVGAETSMGTSMGAWWRELFGLR